MTKLVNKMVCNQPVASDGLQKLSTNMHPIIVDMERNYCIYVEEISMCFILCLIVITVCLKVAFIKRWVKENNP